LLEITSWRRSASSDNSMQRNLGFESSDCSERKINSKYKHVDLISSLLDLWETLPFQPAIEHVRDHQDDLNLDLTLLERLNVRMDSRAKTLAIQQMQSNKSTLYSPSTVGISTVSIVGTHLLKHPNSLYNAILLIRM